MPLVPVTPPDWSQFEILMAVLTAGMVVSVAVQAYFGREVFKLSQRQIEEERKRRIPSIRFVHLTHSFSTSHGLVEFEGFSITNGGYENVVIVSARLELGGSKNEDGSYAEQQIPYGLARKMGEEKLSDFNPPHRIARGESIRILYNVEDLVRTLNSDGEERKVRATCSDSLGNHYYDSAWLSFRKIGDVLERHISDNPGDGYIGSDKWKPGAR